MTYPLQAICSHTTIAGEPVWVSVFEGQVCQHETSNEAEAVCNKINELLMFESLDKAKEFAYNRFID